MVQFHIPLVHPEQLANLNKIQMVLLASAHLHQDIKMFEEVYASLSTYNLLDSFQGNEPTEYFDIGFNYSQVESLLV